MLCFLALSWTTKDVASCHNQCFSSEVGTLDSKADWSVILQECHVSCSTQLIGCVMLSQVCSTHSRTHFLLSRLHGMQLWMVELLLRIRFPVSKYSFYIIQNSISCKIFWEHPCKTPFSSLLTVKSAGMVYSWLQWIAGCSCHPTKRSPW